MSLKRRLIAVGLVAAAAALTFGIAKSGLQVSEELEEPIFTKERDTLYLWYTDEALTSYLSGAAVTYNESHDVRIVPVLQSGLEYLENINRASLEVNAPDMYILGHDSLEKAYLAGLASPVEPYTQVDLESAYISTGLKAASYKDQIIGYPFYFETSSLLYNKTYLDEMACNQLQEELDREMAEAAEAELEENGPPQEATPSPQPSASSQPGTTPSPSPEATATPEPTPTPIPFSQEEIDARVEQLMPRTIEGIREFADNYDAPQQVEAVFRWDVNDIFYNYFFVGNAINVGGEAGWDESQIDIYNLNAIESMRAYQGLNQFFSMDTSQCDYEMLLNDFMAGKIVFTVATTDVVFKLEDAKGDGLLEYDYGIRRLPDINDDIKTRSLSVTNCVVINGYSAYQEEANDFACFLTAEYNDILYARSGKVSAAKDVDYGYDAISEFAVEYERSISMPKMLETSNFWVQLEVAFAQIWDGADANEKLMELSEKIMHQVTGEEYHEEYIEEPEEPEEDEESIEEETEESGTD